MSIKLWIRNLFTGKKEEIDEGEFLALFDDWATEYAARDLAFSTAVGKIARSLAKCEIRTYLDHEEVQGADYYRLNIEPNLNQNSPAWMQELIAKLYRHNEVLVVEFNGGLLIADSFVKERKALYPWTFENVVVDGFEFNKKFAMDEVLYLRLNNKNIKRLLDKIYESYAKMMAAAVNQASRTGSVRGILQMQGMMAGSPAEKKTAQEMLGERFKPLFDSHNAVVPLPQGFNYQDLTKATERVSGGGSITRDYRAMIDDVFDMTAMAFGIPTVLLKGQTAGIEDSVDMYLMDCIDPLADLVETELNRRLYGSENYLKGNRVRIDTSNIKHFELFEVAGPIEKLIGSGAMTINEIRPRIGLKKSEDPIADEHIITKNFGTAAEMVSATGKESEVESEADAEINDS